MTADISTNLLWRWNLKRVWDASRPLLIVCMLNPSTADHMKNDPTILALIDFATRWGFGGIWVVNQFAYRSSSPTVLATLDPVTAEGPLNFREWYDALTYARATGGWALAAWGNGGDNSGRFMFWADLCDVDLYCLGTTADGSPKHPLARGKHHIPRDQQPLLWRKANADAHV